MHEWMADPPPYIIVVIPILAFLEACAVIGIFVSGVFLLSTATLLYSTGNSTIVEIVPLAFLGAMAGDHTGYFLGRIIGDRFWRAPIMRRYEKRKYKVHDLLEKSAPLAICAGRLTPALRSITPIVAGISGLSPTRFLAFDILACAIWATGLYLLVTSLSQLS
ncbi:MAG: DedA family protein [Pseudomonadales bacterium]|nr:DedA family protein [Pseudomonadales bacterium]MBO6658587.1 DedA family protein [Pseudomonadales bacterium]